MSIRELRSLSQPLCKRDAASTSPGADTLFKPVLVSRTLVHLLTAVLI